MEGEREDVRDGSVGDPCLGPVEDVATIDFGSGGLHACWIGAVVRFRQTLSAAVSTCTEEIRPMTDTKSTTVRGCMQAGCSSAEYSHCSGTRVANSAADAVLTTQTHKPRKVQIAGAETWLFTEIEWSTESGT